MKGKNVGKIRKLLTETTWRIDGGVCEQLENIFYNLGVPLTDDVIMNESAEKYTKLIESLRIYKNIYEHSLIKINNISRITVPIDYIVPYPYIDEYNNIYKKINKIEKYPWPIKTWGFPLGIELNKLRTTKINRYFLNQLICQLYNIGDNDFIFFKNINITLINNITLYDIDELYIKKDIYNIPKNQYPIYSENIRLLNAGILPIGAKRYKYKRLQKQRKYKNDMSDVNLRATYPTAKFGANPRKIRFEGQRPRSEAQIERDLVNRQNRVWPQIYNQRVSKYKRRGLADAIRNKLGPLKQWKTRDEVEGCPNIDEFDKKWTFDEVVEALQLYSDIYECDMNSISPYYIVPPIISDDFITDLEAVNFRRKTSEYFIYKNITSIDNDGFLPICCKEFEEINIRYDIKKGGKMEKLWPKYLHRMPLGEYVYMMRFGDIDARQHWERGPILDYLGFNWGDGLDYMLFSWQRMVEAMFFMKKYHWNALKPADFVLTNSLAGIPPHLVGFKYGKVLSICRSQEPMIYFRHKRRYEMLCRFGVNVYDGDEIYKNYKPVPYFQYFPEHPFQNTYRLFDDLSEKAQKKISDEYSKKNRFIRKLAMQMPSLHFSNETTTKTYIKNIKKIKK
eukprot:GHVL01013117.1.p1 GENE.GHVL01013117.1~~GHVL01013117.1.p1  ORF type:complete len:621 (-),score=154.46 GHVL01013117.1:3-1865(-)